MTEDQSTDLEDTFFLDGRSSKQSILQFSPTSSSIRIQNNGHGNRSIPIDDIYGCLCMKAKTNPIKCHLALYMYTVRRSKGVRGTISKKTRQYRSHEIFTYAKFDNFERNFAEITRWHDCIIKAIYLRRNLPRKFDVEKTKKYTLCSS
jgi:hypothetical protein